MTILLHAQLSQKPEVWIFSAMLHLHDKQQPKIKFHVVPSQPVYHERGRIEIDIFAGSKSCRIELGN
jgi:hypothetical protein